MADGNITVKVNARADDVQALVAEVERLQKHCAALGESWNALQRTLAEVERLRAALAELVALQDIKASLPVWPFPNDPDAETRADYKRRRPAAWEAARTALAPSAALAHMVNDGATHA